MERARPYLPLIGFVVPTLVIGYGVVIPRSCIAGVNELSVGFGTTVVGAIVAYVVGLRQQRGCTVPAWKRWLHAFLSRQARRPSGPFGRLLGRLWVGESAALNDRVIDALSVGPGDRVLEVGFGPGETVRKLAERAEGVAGVDVSERMLAQARARNRRALAAGRVRLELGDGRSLPFADASFDKALSVHCLYFWPEPEAYARELARTLAPGATLALAFRTRGSAPPARFRRDVYRFWEPTEVEALLAEAGFGCFDTRPAGPEGTVLLTARRTADRP